MDRPRRTAALTLRMAPELMEKLGSLAKAIGRSRGDTVCWLLDVVEVPERPKLHIPVEVGQVSGGHREL